MNELSDNIFTTTTGESPVAFKNVDYEIDEKLLIKNFNCTLNWHGITVIMGANGAGKSVFLRLLSGLLEPTRGVVVTTGFNQNANDPANISLVFQRPVMLRRTVLANLEFVLKGTSNTKNQRTEKIYKALVIAKLENHEVTQARNLSGGEQQRLAMARAMITSPDILLLDEATANLDPSSTNIVEKMVDDISRKGTKVVFITHDVRQAKRLGDDILFIHEGRKMTHKPAKEFFRDPGSPEAQAYLDGRVLNAK